MNAPSPARPRTRGGFTLVETLAAAAVMGVVAAVAAMAVGRLGDTRSAARAQADAWRSADRAATLIQRAAIATLRRADLAQTRVRITDGGVGAGARDSMTLLVRDLRPVRPPADPLASSEGGEFEVAFRVMQGPRGPGLWQRRDMALDEYQDAGGIAREIAPGVTALSITALDAQGEAAAWDSDTLGLPHAIAIEVRAVSADGRGQAIARRLASLPRVHPQPEPADAGAGSDAGTGAGTSAGSGAGAGAEGGAP